MAMVCLGRGFSISTVLTLILRNSDSGDSNNSLEKLQTQDKYRSNFVMYVIFIQNKVKFKVYTKHQIKGYKLYISDEETKER